jgi:hypothetical protein
MLNLPALEDLSIKLRPDRPLPGHRRAATIRWIQLLLYVSLCFSANGNARDKKIVPKVEPDWSINLKDRYGFEPFDRTISFRWTLYQNVIFISPERVLVYQVNRSHEPVKLGARDASGGVGNFVLDLRVLSTQDGHEIKSMRLPTSAEPSKVLATHDGKFILRTGDILYLYSPDFQKLASKSLPLKRQVQEEVWQVSVSPSGAEIVLAHQQIFHRNALSPNSTVEKASAAIEVLNADTLQTIKTFTLPWFMQSWSAADRFLLTSNPNPIFSTATFGLLDYNGNWSSLQPDWSLNQACAYQAEALAHDMFAAFGCGNLSIFPRTGEKIFSVKQQNKEYFGAVFSNESYMGVRIERRLVKMDNAANIPVAVAQPLRIDFYWIPNEAPIFSVPVHSKSVYSAVSSQGALAVVDGASLQLFNGKH